MISVVVPAYNEAALLGTAVRGMVDGLRALGQDFELHIVENGSTDGTPTVAARIAEAVPEVEVHSMRTANYGEALRTGLLASRADVAVIFDVDFWDLQFMKEALDVLDASADPTGPVVVVGSKRAPGAYDGRSPARRLGTAVFSGLLRLGFGLTVSDTHGMKVLNLQVLRGAVSACRNGSDLFDTELVLRAERSGYAVAEVPVAVTELRPPRTSIVQRVPRTLLGLAKLRHSLAVSDAPDDVTVVPGYVDLQINGVADVDFSRAEGDDWVRAGRMLLAAGVTGHLATICSMPLDRYDDALARVDARVGAGGPGESEILGVHLEGPFLGGALGADPEEMVRPMDLAWLSGLLDRHPGLVRLVTLAPEADPDGAGIRMLAARGVVVVLGHTSCSYEEAVAAAAAGATLATHLFNGMGPLHQRSPGIIGAALDPRVPLTPTLIADLVHVHAALVVAVFAGGRPILVSDAVATGVPYFDAEVTAASGAAYLPDGTLTGAVSLLDAAVRNVVGLGASRTGALVAASIRPAAALGLAAPPGTIELDADLQVVAVRRDGTKVYRRES